ncbi:hypothetical protein JCM11641_007711 [Rhodosporidiobolus odoratus]
MSNRDGLDGRSPSRREARSYKLATYTLTIASSESYPLPPKPTPSCPAFDATEWLALAQDHLSPVKTVAASLTRAMASSPVADPSSTMQAALCQVAAVQGRIELDEMTLLRLSRYIATNLDLLPDSSSKEQELRTNRQLIQQEPTFVRLRANAEEAQAQVEERRAQLLELLNVHLGWQTWEEVRLDGLRFTCCARLWGGIRKAAKLSGQPRGCLAPSTSEQARERWTWMMEQAQAAAARRLIRPRVSKRLAAMQSDIIKRRPVHRLPVAVNSVKLARNVAPATLAEMVPSEPSAQSRPAAPSVAGALQQGGVGYKGADHRAEVQTGVETPEGEGVAAGEGQDRRGVVAGTQEAELSVHVGENEKEGGEKSKAGGEVKGVMEERGGERDTARKRGQPSESESDELEEEEEPASEKGGEERELEEEMDLEEEEKNKVEEMDELEQGEKEKEGEESGSEGEEKIKNEEMDELEEEEGKEQMEVGRESEGEEKSDGEGEKEPVRPRKRKRSLGAKNARVGLRRKRVRRSGNRGDVGVAKLTGQIGQHALRPSTHRWAKLKTRASLRAAVLGDLTKVVSRTVIAYLLAKRADQEVEYETLRTTTPARRTLPYQDTAAIAKSASVQPSYNLALSHVLPMPPRQLFLASSRFLKSRQQAHEAWTGRQGISGPT